MTNQQAADLAPFADTAPDAGPVPSPSCSVVAPTLLPGHVVVVLVAVVSGVWAQGAYFGPAQRIVAVLVAGALAVALRTTPWSGDDTRLPVVAAGAGLAVWAVVSAAVAGHAAGSLSTVALVAGMVAVIVVVRRTGATQRRALGSALVSAGALVGFIGWVGVVWRVSPWALVDQGLWRAATTITYANASAALLVPLALLGLAELTTERQPPWLVGATCILLVGGGATLSRAGALALVAGLAVLVGLRGPKAVLGGAGPPMAGAALALATLTPSLAADSPGHPWLAVVGLASGLAVTVGLTRAARRTRLVAAAGALGLVVALVTFVAVLGFHRATAVRLNLSSPDRARETSAALDLVGREPLTGVGPGRASLRWTDAATGQAMVARYAHDEYLQVAAELGLMGLVMALGLVAAMGVGIWRTRPSASADCPPALWAGVAAALVALAVHSSLDFVWHVTVLPLIGAALAGLATSQPTREKP